MDVQLYLSIIQTIIGSFGIFANGLVCVVIAKVPAMRTLTNAFIFNQAVIDLLGSLFMILHGNIITPSPLHQNAVVAAIQCYAWASNVILWILFVASTFNLSMLTLERYVAIVHPFKYLTYFGRKQATIMLVGVWVLAVGYKSSNAFLMIIMDRSCVYRNLSVAAFMAFGILTFLLEYLIPLIFMTFCYVHIIITLKKASSTINTEPTTGQRGENSMSGSLLRARRNTLKTLFIVFVSYTICWSPNQIAFFLYNLGFQFKFDFNGAFYFISLVLVQLNCCINPIIYAFKYRQFQRSLRVLLKPCFPKLAANLNNETVATITAGVQPNQQEPSLNREPSRAVPTA